MSGGNEKIFLRIFNNGFLSYNGFITDFFGFLAFLAHFDPEFKGVFENIYAGIGVGCFKDIKMRLGPRCSPLLVIIS